MRSARQPSFGQPGASVDAAPTGEDSTSEPCSDRATVLTVPLFTETGADALLTFTPSEVCQPSCANRSSPLSWLADALDNRSRRARLHSASVKEPEGSMATAPWLHPPQGVDTKAWERLQGAVPTSMRFATSSNPSRNSSRAAARLFVADQDANALDDESPERHQW